MRAGIWNYPRLAGIGESTRRGNIGYVELSRELYSHYQTNLKSVCPLYQTIPELSEKLFVFSRGITTQRRRLNWISRFMAQYNSLSSREIFSTLFCSPSPNFIQQKRKSRSLISHFSPNPNSNDKRSRHECRFTLTYFTSRHVFTPHLHHCTHARKLPVASFREATRLYGAN